MSRYHQSYGAKAPSYNANAAQPVYGQRKPAGDAQLSSREILMMKSSFSVFDLDHSGKISNSEFRSTLRCLGYTASDEELDRMMRTYDSNGDGVMDFNEFLSMVKHLKSEGFQYGKQALEKEMKNAFSVLDANGDGHLTPNELSHVLCNTGNRLSRSEFNDFMALFDKDKDGRISCQELINIMCSSLEEHIKQLLP